MKLHVHNSHVWNKDYFLLDENQFVSVKKLNGLIVSFRAIKIPIDSVLCFLSYSCLFSTEASYQTLFTGDEKIEISLQSRTMITFINLWSGTNNNNISFQDQLLNCICVSAKRNCLYNNCFHVVSIGCSTVLFVFSIQYLPNIVGVVYLLWHFSVVFNSPNMLSFIVEVSRFLKNFSPIPSRGLGLESLWINPGFSGIITYPSLELRFESKWINPAISGITHLPFPWVMIRIKMDQSWFYNNI